MTHEQVEKVERLIHRKEADCMVGLSVDRKDVVAAGSAFAEIAFEAMQQVLPVYALACTVANEAAVR
jgi:uncharacterized protein YktB (UPF0637 family)